MLRTNWTEQWPTQLWTFYTQLSHVEEAFKTLKGDLAIRPIFHQKLARIEAHIFVAFLAYCLQVSLRHRLKLQLRLPAQSPPRIRANGQLAAP